MYDIYTDLTAIPNVHPQDIDRFLANCPLNGLGQAFVDSGVEFGINPVFVMSLAILESGWGKSQYAIERNNLFGYMAYDSNPDLAGRFSSKEVCIRFISCFLANSYLKQKNGQYYTLPNGQRGLVGQWYGGSPTAHGIFVNYSSSHDAEALSIVSIMNQFLSLQATAIGGQITLASNPVVLSPINDDSVETYITVPGDTLGAIAKRFYNDYGYWTTLARANDIVDPRRMGVGVVLKLPGRTGASNTTGTSVPNTAGRTYTVQPGDSLWGIAVREYSDGTKYKQIFEANRDQLTDPNIIHVGSVLRIP